MSKRAELEAKLIRNPGDIDLRLVYADLLQSAGDPRGELIVLQHRGADVEAFLANHEDALLGPLARFKKTLDHASADAFHWHLGFIRAAKLGYKSHSRTDSHAAVTADRAVATLLAHPAALLLEELTITMNMLDDGIYFDSVVKAIAAAGAPALRKLRIGEFQHAGPGRIDNGYDYEISWSSLGDARHLWRAVPRLEELRIQAGLGGTSTSGDADVIGTFDLRALRRLEVVTGGMGGACARSFATGKLPALQYAELWFGSKDYGGTATVADLEPLFTGRNVRELAHLGLMNAEITDELVAALARSPLLRQLRTLNLAHGTLSDEGVRIVATHADAFKHLKVLDVSNNYVTSAGLDELRRVCPITSTEQRDTEDDDRYVALAE